MDEPSPALPAPDPTLLRAAFARIDADNAEDPNMDQLGAEVVPKEVLYGRRMSEWLKRLAPGSSAALRIAVRAQHIGRWKIARSAYPEGRTGYKRWRSDLSRMHAERAAEIVREVGYDDGMAQRVADLISKKKMRSDAEAQTLEDVACLVFLEHYFAPFAAKHHDDRVIDIVKKTLPKMSPHAREVALGLELPPRARGLVMKAVEMFLAARP